jgi:hypothetical protein
VRAQSLARRGRVDKRCPLNRQCNIKGGLTVTKGRVQNNGEIFRENKKGTNKPNELANYTVGKKKRIIIKFRLA